MTVPTAPLLAWADLELGLFFHYDIEVFEPDWARRSRFDYTPSPGKFDPKDLDTDQWLKVAVDAGARYALLTAKHGTGFCLWPTETYDYCVRSSPWRGGKGDVVGSFISSCRKSGIEPGIYYHALLNAYCNVKDGLVLSGSKKAQGAYNRIVEGQVEELLTWYGDLLEIWFDGGTISTDKGGPNLGVLLRRLQPEIVAFDGPPEHPHVLRWAGSEHAVSKVDCWSTSDFYHPNDKIVRCDPRGNPDGAVWSPVEAPMPCRDIDRAFFEGWMWHEGEENLVYDAEYLFDRYCTAVGRNSNLLIGALPDTTGLIPDTDAKVFRGLGELLQTRFASPLVETAGRGYDIIVTPPSISDIERIVIMEDQSTGQRVRGWRLEAAWPVSWPEGWFEVSKGCSIGHKRILNIEKLRVRQLRLHITDAIGEPDIRKIAVYGSPA